MASAEVISNIIIDQSTTLISANEISLCFDCHQNIFLHFALFHVILVFNGNKIILIKDFSTFRSRPNLQFLIFTNVPHAVKPYAVFLTPLSKGGYNLVLKKQMSSVFCLSGRSLLISFSLKLCFVYI